MANKIIGFFNSKERAEQVRDDLIEAGFNRTDIQTYQGKDEPGLWDRMKEWFGYADEQDRYLYHEAARRGGVAVVCDASDEDTPAADKAARIMQRHNPIDLEAQSAQWRKEGWEGYKGPVPQRATGTTTGTAGAVVSGQPAQPAQPARTPTTRPAATGKAADSESIPVVQEELHVGKRTILQGGVRVHSRVTERPVEKQVELREERVQVERRPTDRPVRPGERAFEERSIEATESAEKAVVNKEAKVVEEVNVRKDVTQRTETVRDTVRRTDVDVEKLSGERPGTAVPGAGTGAGIGSTTGGATTGSGYAGDTAYAGAQSRDFDASTFVSDMNRDRRYQGKEWDACEADYYKAYQQRYPQGKWDQVKDKVRTEYNRARNKV